MGEFGPQPESKKIYKNLESEKTQKLEEEITKILQAEGIGDFLHRRNAPSGNYHALLFDLKLLKKELRGDINRISTRLKEANNSIHVRFVKVRRIFAWIFRKETESHLGAAEAKSIRAYGENTRILKALAINREVFIQSCLSQIDNLMPLVQQMIEEKSSMSKNTKNKLDEIAKAIPEGSYMTSRKGLGSDEGFNLSGPEWGNLPARSARTPNLDEQEGILEEGDPIDKTTLRRKRKRFFKE